MITIDTLSSVPTDNLALCFASSKILYTTHINTRIQKLSKKYESQLLAIIIFTLIFFFCVLSIWLHVTLGLVQVLKTSFKSVIQLFVCVRLLINNIASPISIPIPRFSIIYHGPCQIHKVQRLSEYTQYKFKIQACNEAGDGPLSNIYTFTTTKTPPATLKGKCYKL